MQVFLFQCLLHVTYIIEVKPYEENVLNYLEIFNETCIFTAGYHQIVFSSFVSDAQIKYKAGWSVVGVTILNIAVNMTYMICITCKQVSAILRKCKKRLDQRKAKKYQQ